MSTETNSNNNNTEEMNEAVINVSVGTTRSQFIVLLDMPRIPNPHRFIWRERKKNAHTYGAPFNMYVCACVSCAAKQTNGRTSDDDEPTNEGNNIKAIKIRRNKQKRPQKK